MAATVGPSSLLLGSSPLETTLTRVQQTPHEEGAGLFVGLERPPPEPMTTLCELVTIMGTYWGNNWFCLYDDDI